MRKLLLPMTDQNQCYAQPKNQLFSSTTTLVSLLQLTDTCQREGEAGEACGVMGGKVNTTASEKQKFMTPLFPLRLKIDYFKGHSIKLCS